MTAVQESLQAIISKSDAIMKSQDPDQLNYLQSLFRKLEASSRESFQEKLYPEAEEIVRKLQSDEPLSHKEKRALELLIIGDAEYYTKIENNFGDWMTEFNRLLSELNKYSTGSQNVEEMCHLRALAQDALNLLPSITYFIRAHNRMSKIREVLSGSLEMEDRMMLASIVKTAMESDLQ